MKQNPCGNTPVYSKLPGPGNMAGLSLIELMIAMLLGIILTLGATQVYLGTSQSYRLTEAVAHAQENIRFASSVLQRDLRGAGGFGCLQNAEDVIDQLNGTRVLPVSEGLTGWEAAGTGVGDALSAVDTEAADGSQWSQGGSAAAFPAVLAGDVITGTDVLVVNSARTVFVGVTDRVSDKINLGGASGIAAGQSVLAITDSCAAGELFQNSASDSDSFVKITPTASNPLTQGNSVAAFALDYNADARISAYETVAYYIGLRTSNGVSVPVLYRQKLDTEPQPPQELIEGVESMQLLYGVSNGVVQRADSYVTADNVNNWENVVSIRVAVVVRSDDSANSEELTRTFNLLGTEVTTLTDRHARLVATSTIGLRNRLE